MNLYRRIVALERRVRLPEDQDRVILVWADEDGRLTKVADTQPELPDDGEYRRDLVGSRFSGSA
jgi:hypothetical protein